MSLHFTLQGFLGNSRFFASKSTDSLAAKEKFRKLIERERERAGRNGSVFSLVLIEIGSWSGAFINPQQMQKRIAASLRNVDEIGWYDDAHIGILLPYTSGEGAVKLMNRINKSLAVPGGVNHRIFLYPDKPTC